MWEDEHCFNTLFSYVDMNNWEEKNINGVEIGEMKRYTLMVVCYMKNEWHWRIDYEKTSEKFTDIGKYAVSL